MALRVNLVMVAPTAEAYVRMGEAIYISRLKRLCTLQREELRLRGKRGKIGGDDLCAHEAPLLLAALEGKKNVWLLDEQGVQMTSCEFANLLHRVGTHEGGEISFAIGGAYGFGKEVLERYGARRLSLSKMTFTHQMVRLIFLEQLYRGFMILRGGNYHH